LVVVTLAPVSTAAAARSWVKGDVLLNVRTGPGSEHRPLGAITTGDPVEILDQSNGWTQVRSDAVGEGWIPSGFLQEEPPAVVRLEQVEAEATTLRQRVDELTAEAESLRAAQQQAATAVNEQSQEIERLSAENAALQSDVIWPVMLTGASILMTGGLVGAWARGAGRRSGQRVRL
ncbi:MAG: TIGR04211 family SH3 domain-containing protein, partial [Myxococcales bacterium]